MAQDAAFSTARSSGQAIIDSFKKAATRASQIRNPVMFVVLIGTVVTFVESIAHPGIFDWSITVWLFLTLFFANFAEAMAEGRGKAQADTLRKMRSETEARHLLPGRDRAAGRGGRAAPRVTASSARRTTSSPPTARSPRASPRSTSPRSPASRLR